MVEPALVEVDGGECEDEVSEPVRQAEEVRLGGRVRGRNHKVKSCDGWIGGLLLVNVRCLERRGDCRCGQNHSPLRKWDDPHRIRRC